MWLFLEGGLARSFLLNDLKSTFFGWGARSMPGAGRVGTSSFNSITEIIIKID